MEGYWVQVDTEILRAFSKEYRTRADVINEAGKGIQYLILSIIDRMPDYDGRLQQAARADALDFYNQSQQFFNGFIEDSDSLLNTAQAFENIDHQTVHIFEECQGITSTACLIDAKGTPGLGTTTIQEEVINPDGSVSTITIVKTIDTDGSVTTITTIKTIKVLDAEIASQWNKEKAIAEIFLAGTIFFLAGVAIPPLVVSGLGLSGDAAAMASLGTKGIISGSSLTLSISKVLEPDKGWKEGDTITNTVTMVTTEQPDINSPEAESPPCTDITNTTVVTDNQGNILSEDKTGIEATGALK